MMHWLVALLLLAGWRVTAQMTADSVDVNGPWSTVNGSGASASDGVASRSTALQPRDKVSVAKTYRNAYGTHFECSSTCLLLLVMYAVLVTGGLLLLSLIPVRFAATEKLEAPFVLWFGEPKKMKRKKVVKQEEQEEEEEQVVQTERWWSRATTWVVQNFLTATPGPHAEVRYRFHADMTQQLAASAAAAKTYESIAVGTDDLIVELPPPVVESLPPTPSPPLTPPSKAPSRSSIFMGAPPSPSAVSRRRQPSSRLGSDMSADLAGRRTSRAGSGVETKDDLVRAVARRQSMDIRTERRIAVAQEDVSYENLGDEEIRTYEYLEFVRELLDGLSLKKVCQKSGRVVSRTLYITPDMTVIFWNPAGTIKWMSQKSSLQTITIEQVLKGLHGSASAMARSSPERDALCVSIGCSNGKWLVLEAKTEAMRQRLYLGFSRLAEEKQHEKEAEAKEAEAKQEIESGTQPAQGRQELKGEVQAAEEKQEQVARSAVAKVFFRPVELTATTTVRKSTEETVEREEQPLQSYEIEGQVEGRRQTLFTEGERFIEQFEQVQQERVPMHDVEVHFAEDEKSFERQEQYTKSNEGEKQRRAPVAGNEWSVGRSQQLEERLVQPSDIEGQAGKLQLAPFDEGDPPIERPVPLLPLDEGQENELQEGEEKAPPPMLVQDDQQPLQNDIALRMTSYEVRQDGDRTDEGHEESRARLFGEEEEEKVEGTLPTVAISGENFENNPESSRE